jgi:hypothetical protein
MQEEGIRHRVMKVPQTLPWYALYGKMPDKAPSSRYVKLRHNGETWHLFNAKFFPLGRMAQTIANAL